MKPTIEIKSDTPIKIGAARNSLNLLLIKN
jgi:hypothetical protein